jgi:hypothetical protein
MQSTNIECAFFLLLFSVLIVCVHGKASHKYDHDMCRSNIPTLVRESLAKWPEITAADFQKSKYFAGLRFQLIDGEWFTANETTKIIHSRNAAMKLIFLTLHEQNHLHFPHNLDFYIDTSDGDLNDGPVLSYCTRYNHTGITVPDYSFLAWPESGQDTAYLSLYDDLLALAEKPKEFSDRLLFVGNMFPRRKKLLMGTKDEYVHIQHHRFSPQSSERTVPIKYQSYVPVQEMCKHKYLLHVPGAITYSSRLKYLMFCKSLVIWLDEFQADGSPYYKEWFYPALKPWVHYIPAHNGSELNTIMHRIREKQISPKQVESIIEKGQTLVRNLLHPDCVRAFWIAFLEEYGKRMKFTVDQPAPDARNMIIGNVIDIRQADIVREKKRTKKTLVDHVRGWINI